MHWFCAQMWLRAPPALQRTVSTHFLPWTLAASQIYPHPSPPTPTPGVALPFYPGFTCNSALLARGETAAPMRAQVQPLCKLTRKKATWIEWQTRRWWHIPRRAQSMCHYSMPVKLSVKQLRAICACVLLFFFFCPAHPCATCWATNSSKARLNLWVDNAEMNHFRRGGSWEWNCEILSVAETLCT